MNAVQLIASIFGLLGSLSFLLLLIDPTFLKSLSLLNFVGLSSFADFLTSFMQSGSSGAVSGVSGGLVIIEIADQEITAKSLLAGIILLSAAAGAFVVGAIAIGYVWGVHRYGAPWERYGWRNKPRKVPEHAPNPAPLPKLPRSYKWGGRSR